MSFLPSLLEWALAGLVGALACLAPLARTLGYESAMIIAIVTGLIALRRGLLEGRDLLEARGGDGTTLRRRPRVRTGGADGGDGEEDLFRRAGEAFCRSTGAALSAALLPYTMLVVSTRLLQGCRLAPGTLLALFLAVPAAPHFAAVGLAVGASVRRYWASISVVGLLIGIHFVHPALQALAGRTIPHSLPFGFLSASGWGGVGSTDLDLPPSYFLLRGFAVAVCPLLTGLAGLSGLRAERRRLIRSSLASSSPASAPPGPPRTARGPLWTAVFFALAAAPVALAAVFPSSLGLTSGVETRERALSGWSRTAHVLVRFTPGGLAAPQAAALAADAEWDVQIASAIMELSDPAAVTVWIYDDEDQMRLLTGADEFLFALPWRREVHTLWSAEGAKALRHELVHVLAGDWTRQPLRISWNQAMLEGTAEAIASYGFRGNAFQKQAAAALAAGRLTSAASLFSATGFAWGENSLRNSYELASSFIGFLLERYGPRPLSRAYGGESWERTYGKGLPTLDAEWRERLSRIPVSSEEKEKARATFDPRRNPAFFRRRCPRVGIAAVAAGDRRSRARTGPTAVHSPRTPREAGVSIGPLDGDSALKGDGRADPARARGIAAAAAASGRSEEIRDAALELRRVGLPAEAIDLLEKSSRDASFPRGARLDLSRSLFLHLLAIGRDAEAEALLVATERDLSAPRSAVELYRMALASPSRTDLAAGLLHGSGGGEGSRAEGNALLRRALREDPGGPAALVLADQACSWPPRGTDAAGPRLYARFLEEQRDAGPSDRVAGVALRLGQHALREGRREEAMAFFRRAMEATPEARRRLEAAEGMARASGLTGARFVHEELPRLSDLQDFETRPGP